MNIRQMTAVVALGLFAWKGLGWYQKNQEKNEIRQVTQAISGPNNENGPEMIRLGQLLQNNELTLEQQTALLQQFCDITAKIEGNLNRVSVGKRKPVTFKDTLLNDFQEMNSSCRILLVRLDDSEAGQGMQKAGLNLAMHVGELKNYMESQFGWK